MIEVREIHEAYSNQLERIAAAHSRIANFAAELPNGPLSEMIEQFQEELHYDLNVNTIDRLADFERLADDNSINNEQKLALALSGWLAGGQSVDNLTIASSMWRTRDIIQKYLVSKDETDRKTLLTNISSEDANSPEYVAKLLAAMKPPLAHEVNLQAEERTEGDDAPGNRTLEYEIEGVDGKVRYLVQLPPEYDPHRRYPTILTLHAAGSRS